MAIADKKAMVIASESRDSQESNIYELLVIGDIIFFCQVFWLLSLNLSRRYHGLQPLLI